MSKPSKRPAGEPSRRPATRQTAGGQAPPAGKPAGKPGKPTGLLGKWWVQLLITAWILAVVTIYFRLQLLRLLGMAMRTP